MHRTVIERIGVYHYRATGFSPRPVASAPVNYQSRILGYCTATSGPTSGKGFSGNGRHLAPRARNDDFDRDSARSGA